MFDFFPLLVGNGYAASILAALVVLGVLALVMIFISSKPRNRRRH